MRGVKETGFTSRELFAFSLIADEKIDGHVSDRTLGNWKTVHVAHPEASKKSSVNMTSVVCCTKHVSVSSVKCTSITYSVGNNEERE